ncbi:MAG: tetraacyldisaccharide 4'-kinase [Pyrinomonadaceae bacterium]
MSLFRELAFPPLSVGYGAATRARLMLYRCGALSATHVEAPVISVGNITAGGTGKTPLVEWLARALVREKRRRVCILTRGYGRADAGRRVVVSDGEQILAGAREGGDEPLLLAETLRGLAAVISDANRVAAAQWAIKSLGSEVFILDDGFQHLRLARDLNLLTLDATDPWGGAKLLPGGRLREPLGEMKRADAIIITRAELAADLRDLRARAQRLSGGRPVFIARTTTLRVALLAASPADKAVASTDETNTLPEPLAAFCAIGNASAFFAYARREGFMLCHTRAFADHHVYTQSEIDDCVREAARHGAQALLTTAKDAVKLRALEFTLPCYVLEVALTFDDERAMLAMLYEAMLHGEL